MYLHLGQETVVKTEDIIGIFDLDTSTVAKSTRDFLSVSEKEKQVINVTDDLPKTFVLVKGKKQKNCRVYISQLSSSTLQKRNGENL
ncbi:MAG: DUF370 domain-containing protein [Clostridia bacterium]|nr:DUF370 domain-containing protein [Clostridia bacterium]